MLTCKIQLPAQLQLFQVLTTGPLCFVSALLLQNVVRDPSAWDPRVPLPQPWAAQQFPFPSHSALQVISIFTFPSHAAGTLYLSLRWSN